MPLKSHSLVYLPPLSVVWEQGVFLGQLSQESFLNPSTSIAFPRDLVLGKTFQDPQVGTFSLQHHGCLPDFLSFSEIH